MGRTSQSLHTSEKKHLYGANHLLLLHTFKYYYNHNYNNNYHDNNYHYYYCVLNEAEYFDLS